MNAWRWLLKVPTYDLFMRIQMHMEKQMDYMREQLHVPWRKLGEVEKFSLMAAVFLKGVALTVKEMEDEQPYRVESE